MLVFVLLGASSAYAYKKYVEQQTARNEAIRLFWQERRETHAEYCRLTELYESLCNGGGPRDLSAPIDTDHVARSVERQKERILGAIANLTAQPMRNKHPDHPEWGAGYETQ